MSGGHGFEIDWNDPYVIDAAGFWLHQVRSNHGQPPNRQAVEKRRKRFFEKRAECLKMMTISQPAVSSSCTLRSEAGD